MSRVYYITMKHGIGKEWVITILIICIIMIIICNTYYDVDYYDGVYYIIMGFLGIALLIGLQMYRMHEYWKGGYEYGHYKIMDRSNIGGDEIFRTSSGKNPKKQLLVLGDSLVVGYGLGPDDPKLPDILSQELDVEIDSIARTGWKISDMLEYIKENPLNLQSQYDRILILLGANDILGNVDLADSAQDMVKLCKILLSHVRYSKDIIILHGGRCWNKPILVFPYNKYVHARTLEIHSLYQNICKKLNMKYIHLFDIEDELHADNDLHIDGAHWNNRGTQMLADLIISRI